jgi:putative transposase
VLDEVRVWQSRPLESLAALVYLDALVVKVRPEGGAETRAVFVASGITLDGQKEVLGFWTSATEGAKLWRQILTEIRHRGVSDIGIACLDGLKGFPEAIQPVFPKTQVQLCILHLVRNSLRFVNGETTQAGRRQSAADLSIGPGPRPPPSTIGWSWNQIGTPSTRWSANSGGGRGPGLFPCLRFPRRSANSFTPPTPSTR